LRKNPTIFGTWGFLFFSSGNLVRKSCSAGGNAGKRVVRAIALNRGVTPAVDFT
jgi:hypothetical protein